MAPAVTSERVKLINAGIIEEDDRKKQRAQHELNSAEFAERVIGVRIGTTTSTNIITTYI